MLCFAADLSLLPTLGSNEGAGRKLLIIDARSYTAAWANRAKGGGCECPGKEGRGILGVGLGGEGVMADVSLLPTLGSNESTGRKLLIFDAWSYTVAWANRAKGGGC